MVDTAYEGGGTKLFDSLDLAIANLNKIRGKYPNIIPRIIALTDGEDNCQPIYVPRSSLIDLKITCEEVLADHSRAEELLPTGAGFFFGSTEYDEWYFHGVEKTVEIVSKLIEDVPEGWAFEYQASW